MAWQTNQNKSYESPGEGKVSPDAYLDLCIRNSLNSPFQSLKNGRLTDGMISAVISVEQLEKLAKAKGIFEKQAEMEKYETDLKEAIAKLDEKDKKDETLWKFKISNEKLYLICRKLFLERFKRKTFVV